MRFNTDLREVAVYFLAVLISLVIHEYAHAWMADRLGDDTPRRHGRMTFNPVVLFQANPFGALLVPILGALQGGLIGWATTPVNPSRVRREVTIRKAEFLIAIAGPAANVLLMLVAVGLYAVAARIEAEWAMPLRHLTSTLAIANAFLAVFNMLPFAPLDGHTVLASRAPDSWAPALAFLQQYGFYILIGIVIFGQRLFDPFIHFAVMLLQAVR